MRWSEEDRQDEWNRARVAFARKDDRSVPSSGTSVPDGASILSVT
jgi:hypothetical protein